MWRKILQPRFLQIWSAIGASDRMLSLGNIAGNEENRNSRLHFPTMHSSPPPRSFKHRTTDLRVGLVFRDSIVKKYYRKYCLVRTRTPQAEGESRGHSRARGIIWKLRKTAMLQPFLMQDNRSDNFLIVPSKAHFKLKDIGPNARQKTVAKRERRKMCTVNLPLS